MARKSSTPTSTPTSSHDSALDYVDALSAPGVADVSSAPGVPEAAPPVKRRKRGPNKPKPGTFTVRTEAVLNQTEIRRLLTAHAVAMLGEDVAAKMALQVNVDGEWRPLDDDPSQGVGLQFATAVEASA
jgi:hypothetical protein